MIPEKWKIVSAMNFLFCFAQKDSNLVLFENASLERSERVSVNIEINVDLDLYIIYFVRHGIPLRAMPVIMLTAWKVSLTLFVSCLESHSSTGVLTAKYKLIR